MENTFRSQNLKCESFFFKRMEVSSSSVKVTWKDRLKYIHWKIVLLFTERFVEGCVLQNRYVTKKINILRDFHGHSKSFWNTSFWNTHTHTHSHSHSLSLSLSHTQLSYRKQKSVTVIRWHDIPSSILSRFSFILFILWHRMEGCRNVYIMMGLFLVWSD